MLPILGPGFEPQLVPQVTEQELTGNTSLCLSLLISNEEPTAPPWLPCLGKLRQARAPSQRPSGLVLPDIEKIQDAQLNLNVLVNDD